jgi:beta-mannosidase
MEFPRVPISTTVERTTKREFRLELHSRGFQHAVEIDLPGIAHTLEDNFFDLYPGESRKVRLCTEKAAILAEIKRAITTRSLADIN